jgi:hypothetical protein
MDLTNFQLWPALVLCPSWILLAWGASLIARNQGESPTKWFALGLVLGPFSWLGAKYSGKVCLHCRSRIHRMAIVCPNCRCGQTIEGRVPGDLANLPEALIAVGNFESDN